MMPMMWYVKPQEHGPPARREASKVHFGTYASASDTLHTDLQSSVYILVSAQTVRGRAQVPELRVPGQETSPDYGLETPYPVIEDNII
jgi:hypothetical protein